MNKAQTISGGAGAVTLYLPTALGFNGTCHLIHFGSGLANANGFQSGTVHTLAWNQTASLQLKGNDLDYMSPPPATRRRQPWRTSFRPTTSETSWPAPTS